MSSPHPISPRKKILQPNRSGTISIPSQLRRSPSPPHKKRRVESDFEDLVRLYKMAKETMLYCEERLRMLGSSGRDIEAASNKQVLASCHDPSRTSISNYVIDADKDTIGGIPRKFLDLTHFNYNSLNDHIRKKETLKLFDLKSSSECNKCHGNISKNKTRNAHVIIADENNHSNINSYNKNYEQHDNSSYSAPTSNYTCYINNRSNLRKQTSNRIQITNAPLPHVNGTYIQDGLYNNAPLFVRVGPARKFMGFDCRVVLRREVEQIAAENNATDCVNIGDAATKYNEKNDSNSTDILSNKTNSTWKIGLVPSHTISHRRLIGYYEGTISNDQTNDNNTEPPMEGWRVPGSMKKVGGLRILYEE